VKSRKKEKSPPERSRRRTADAVRGLFSGGCWSGDDHLTGGDEGVDLAHQAPQDVDLVDTFLRHKNYAVGGGIVHAVAIVNEQSALQHGISDLVVCGTRVGDHDGSAALDLGGGDIHGLLLRSMRRN
jgi:hypothetical protein